MGRWFKLFVAAGFPWVTLLMRDNLAGAFLAFLMQASVIGWIPAAIWAVRLVHEDEVAEKLKARSK